MVGGWCVSLFQFFSFGQAEQYFVKRYSEQSSVLNCTGMYFFNTLYKMRTDFIRKTVGVFPAKYMLCYVHVIQRSLQFYPFFTLTNVLHLKDSRQSNKQTNTIPMDLNSSGGDQYTQNHPQRDTLLPLFVTQLSSVRTPVIFG